MADVLVIDDEENITFSIQLALQRAGHEIRTAHSVADGTAAIRDKAPDVALVDMQLPDGDGLDLVELLHGEAPETPVIVITAFGSVARAVDAMKRGASDFLQKPLSMEEVGLTIDRCLENRRIKDRLDAFAHNQRRTAGDVAFIGESAGIVQVLELARRIATLDEEPGGGLISVLILGDTGTGKEVLARFIHGGSSRADRPFVHVNCTAIPESLFESELFGHEKGTFTDAKEARKGLFEIADEGTLFLDEIGDMPAGLQAKLLVAIERVLPPPGRARKRSADVRVIAATNTDLDAKVESGQFRRDLYFRLKSFELELPPLRERGDDIILLAEFYLAAACRKLKKPAVTLSDGACRAMRGYQWPGNVRELAHTLQRAVLLCDGRQIDAADLALSGRSGAAAEVTSAPQDLSDVPLAELEQRAIVAALEACAGNVSEAARRLGLSRGGLRHRMQRYGLSPEA